MATTTKKKVRLTLAGLDGNAFVLLGAFRRQAKREGWSEAEIDGVMTDAKSGNYDHLLEVLVDHCEDADDDSEESAL